MTTAFTVIGGIGLFLLGISLMTDGLKSLAGNMLKQLLSKFTGGLFPSILSGATITSIIQSSSATMFMTIGFVNAGLLTFDQAVGVILGANLGTSSIGWIVSLIGFKVKMGVISLPLIGIGVLLKMFSRERFAPHGMVLAGFGLLFFGIDVLQQGMAGFNEKLHFEAFSANTFINRFILIIIGIVMTIVMQSSSAAFVTTLTALNAHTVTFSQAAELAIGQYIGTTFKSFIASLGGTVGAKQTATAHVMFNLLIGLISFLILPLLISAAYWLSKWLSIADQATQLALFHTIFNVFGVTCTLLVLPLFKKLILRLVPNKGVELTKYLNSSVTEVPSVALEAVRRSLIKIMKTVVKSSQQLFINKKADAAIIKEWSMAEGAIVEVQNFMEKLSSITQHMSRNDYNNHVAIIHAIDHMKRFLKTVKENEKLAYVHLDDNVKEVAERVTDILIITENELDYENMDELVMQVEENAKIIADIRRADRKRFLKTPAKNMLNIDDAIQMVHVIHWLDTISYHLWRIIYYLSIIDSNVEEEE